MNEFQNNGLSLTPEQRDRVLDLAARLQAQHEAGVQVDDLVQAAAEAGIDARFVHQAARAIVQTPPTPPTPSVIVSPDRTIACILLGVLTLFNVVISLTHWGGALNRVGAVWFVLLAAVTGFWSVKGRLPVWLVSAVLMMTLLITQTVDQMAGHRFFDRYREIATMMLVFQAFVALVVGGVTRLVDLVRTSKAPSTTQ